MRHRYFFASYTNDGLACLEDKEGRSLYIPAEWLPEAAAPGASVRLRVRRSFEVASLSVRVNVSDKDTPVPIGTLEIAPTTSSSDNYEPSA